MEVIKQHMRDCMNEIESSEQILNNCAFHDDIRQCRCNATSPEQQVYCSSSILRVDHYLVSAFKLTWLFVDRMSGAQI